VRVENREIPESYLPPLPLIPFRRGRGNPPSNEIIKFALEAKDFSGDSGRPVPADAPSKEEFANLKSQIVISSWGGLRRSTPYAFTEQGVAMLSSVLRSKRAIQVNIEIMRAFVKLRQILASHSESARKLESLEKKYDSQFKVVFDAIRQLMAPPEKASKKIGFQLREKRASYGKG
jgi:hypothetical protein